MAIAHETVRDVTRAQAVSEELPNDLMHLHQGHKIAINALPEGQREMVARVVDEEDLVCRDQYAVTVAGLCGYP